jgi:hypothetical protein
MSSQEQPISISTPTIAEDPKTQSVISSVINTPFITPIKNIGDEDYIPLEDLSQGDDTDSVKTPIKSNIKLEEDEFSFNYKPDPSTWFRKRRRQKDTENLEDIKLPVDLNENDELDVNQIFGPMDDVDNKKVEYMNFSVQLKKRMFKKMCLFFNMELELEEKDDELTLTEKQDLAIENTERRNLILYDVKLFNFLNSIFEVIDTCTVTNDKLKRSRTDDM